jgi:hypothetical protein
MCSRDYGIKGYPICSGNGICDTIKDICICNDQWTSSTDFIMNSGYDCDNNIVYMKTIGGVGLSISIIGIIIGTINISNLLPITKKKLATDTRLKFTLVALMALTSSVFFFVLKLLDPAQHTVGRSLLMDIAFSISFPFVIISASLFVHTIIEFYVKYTNKVAPRNHSKSLSSSSILLLKRVLIGVCFFSCLNCLIPIALVLIPNTGDIVLAIAIPFHTFVLLSLGLCSKTASGAFVHEVGDHLQGKAEADIPPV